MKKFIIFFFLIIITSFSAYAETIITNADLFAALYGSAEDSLDFSILIDGSNFGKALKKQQILHPTEPGLFLIQSIKNEYSMDVYGYAFSSYFLFGSSYEESSYRIITPIVTWNNKNTISIRNGKYKDMKIELSGVTIFSLLTDSGSFIGIKPDEDETIIYISDPGNVSEINYNYDEERIVATWQGTSTQWQGEYVLW